MITIFLLMPKIIRILSKDHVPWRYFVYFFSSHLHKHIKYSSRANTVAGNLFILRFLVLHHQRTCFMVAQSSLERSWKWRSRDFHAFLDTVNREIYLERLIVFIKISKFGSKYQYSYRKETDRDISPYRFIEPPLLMTGFVVQAHIWCITSSEM